MRNPFRWGTWRSWSPGCPGGSRIPSVRRRSTCFQIMECERPELLEQWMAQWRDVVDFEVAPVMTSAEAAAAIAPRL